MISSFMGHGPPGVSRTSYTSRSPRVLAQPERLDGHVRMRVQEDHAVQVFADAGSVTSAVDSDGVDGIPGPLPALVSSVRTRQHGMFFSEVGEGEGAGLPRAARAARLA